MKECLVVLLSEVRFGFSGVGLGSGFFFFFCRSGSDDNIMQKFPNFSFFFLWEFCRHTLHRSPLEADEG